MRFLAIYRASLILLMCVAAPSVAMASHACWIDHVKSTPEGMALVFETQVNVSGLVTYQNASKKSVRFSVQNGITRVSADGGNQGGNAEILLQDGDLVFVNQRPEDSCVLHAVTEGGRGGIRADAQSQPPVPGSRSVSSSEFIPAD
jgi:hypothetical protein